jgi:hypothetical protein
MNVRKTNSFSRLTQTQTRVLHRELAKKYTELTESQLTDVYNELKSEHDDLKSERERMLASNRQTKESATSIRRAEEAVVRAKNAASSQRGIMGSIASLFSTQEPSKEEQAAKSELLKIRAQVSSQASINYDFESVHRRSHIFHELKVISALRIKLREKRLKLASKKAAKKTSGK